MSVGYEALTEKEKQTLRLVLRGYDAKSMARHLGLSVHTINERLRFARRKMEVCSSREAARMLLAKEGDDANSLVHEQLGEARRPEGMTGQMAPNDGQGTRHLLAWAIGGMVIMSLLFATLLLASAQQAVTSSAGFADTAQPDAVPSTTAVESEIVRSARHWLALVDSGRWNESWDATGRAFKQLNTGEKWASVSRKVRPPLGAVLSRIAKSQERVPAPPYGYEMVKFQTSFAHRHGVTETVTLVREAGGWRVVGYVIG